MRREAGYTMYSGVNPNCMMSNTADIMHSLYGQDFYPDEATMTDETKDNRTISNIWEEVPADMSCPLSTEEEGPVVYYCSSSSGSRTP